jgi:hypothetical protein
MCLPSHRGLLTRRSLDRRAGAALVLSKDVVLFHGIQTIPSGCWQTTRFLSYRLPTGGPPPPPVWVPCGLRP